MAYDISDPKRLRKVATACEDFGVSQAVFGVFVPLVALPTLYGCGARLYDLIDLKEDQVLFIPLCGKCVNEIEALGRPTEAHDAKDVVVVV